MKKYFTLYVIFVLILSIFSTITFSISFAQTIDTSQNSKKVTNSLTLLHSIPAAYQNGRSGYSDPLDEQVSITSTINRLQESPGWDEMAIIIAYDDSGDGTIMRCLQSL